MGATEIPPWDDVVSGRVRVAGFGAVVDVVDACDDPEFDRTGEIVAIADPGLGGRFLELIAFFWANIASLSEGFELVIVLLDRPKPGRGAGSDFLGELGFAGSFCSNFCAVESRLSIILHQKLV